MQPAEPLVRKHTTRRFGTRPAVGRSLPQPEMRAVVMVVAYIFSEQALQMAFVKCDDVIQQFAAPSCGADPSIPVSASMLESDLLNHAPHFHVFLDWCSVLQRTIKTGSADLGELTHSLDA